MSTGADLPVDGVDVASYGPGFAVLNCVARADHAAVEALLHLRGFGVLRLDGARVRDKATLLAQAHADLPPVADLAPGDWDALADHLRDVLLDLGQDQVALLWTDADRILGSDLQDLLDALAVITGVADDAWRSRATTLLTFLIGDGPQFRRLAAMSRRAMEFTDETGVQ